MSTELFRRLRSLRTTEKRIAPDAAWVRATRETLRMQVKNTMPAENSITFAKRMRVTLRSFAPRELVAWVQRPIVAAFSLILVLAGGSIVSVSAAEQALPGDLLYSLKLATEQARLAFTPVKQEKLKLKTEFTNRRVDELKQVSGDTQHPDRVVQVAEILKQDLNTLKQQLDDVVQDGSADTAAAAAKLVDQKSTEVISALQQTKSGLNPETKLAVTEAQSAAADTSVKAIEILAGAHDQSNDAVSTSDVEQAIKAHVQAVADVTSSTASTLNTTTTIPLLNATTTPPITNIVVSSTDATTSTLPALIGQMKDATTQAFAIQKAIDQQAVTDASAPADNGSAVAVTSTDATATTTTSIDAGSASSTDVTHDPSKTTSTQTPP